MHEQNNMGGLQQGAWQSSEAVHQQSRVDLLSGQDRNVAVNAA